VGATDVHRRKPTRPGRPRPPRSSSQGADHKAATKTTTDDLSAHGFTALPEHLAPLTRFDLRYGADTGGPVPTLAEPTPDQAAPSNS